jgi:glycolate oxidase
MSSGPPDAALRSLAAALPAGALQRDPDALDAYAGDESGVAPVRPAAAVRARSVEDVQATLAWATEHGVPVTARGGGTGKAGGCVPSSGGVVLSLVDLDGVRSVRPDHGWAEVDAGVITGPFRDLVDHEHRLFYPPDPGSLDSCTLGGNVATNAGGPVALKYGVTRDYVLGLEAVLADGTKVDFGRRQPKGVAGYDLARLLVGSEGTLAVITGVRLSLRARPQEIVAALMPFATVDDAARAVTVARQSGLEPRALEFFDGTALRRAGREPGFPCEEGWGALLLVEFDGEPGVPEVSLARFAESLGDRGPIEVRVATDEARRRGLWQLRRNTSRLVKVGATGWITEDVAVPLGALPALVEALPRIGERFDLTAFGYGHAGDGNLHVNLLWHDPSGAERAEAAADAVIDAALNLGGTISAEHGVGLAKRRFLPREVGDRGMALMRAIKDTFDPAGILNPGKVLSR